MRCLILLLCIIMATGCDRLAIDHPSPVENSADKLTRYVDRDNGVICYQVFYASTTSVSCVKVEVK